jgi:regulatory protein
LHALDAAAARRVAADLLSRRPWTSAMLAARLRRRGATAEVAALVVAELTARGHIDDARFARHWVEARAARGYGVGRLRSELAARGVARPVIDTALAALDPGTELERVLAVARRRLDAVQRAAPDRAARRLRDYLLRRGYAAPVVAQVVRECAGSQFDE